MKLTPHSARLYLLLAAFLIALPSISKAFYPGIAGQLLVSVAGQAEPFTDTVLYITSHDFFSAHAIILNKPESDPDRGAVFRGGPVGLKTFREYDVTGEVRLYRGYAGWAVWQLDYELIRNLWHVIPADEAILQAPPEAMWPMAIERVRAIQAARPHLGVL